MFLLRRPTDRQAREFLRAQAALPLSYSPVGMSLGVPPRGFALDRRGVTVGSGDGCFRAAAAVLREWRFFEGTGIEVLVEPGPPAVGKDLVLIASHVGLWSVNGSRVVSVVDEPGRYGFSYGTLRGHSLRGEESFTVSVDDGGIVTLEITACSRPGQPLAWIGYPVVRRFQGVFAARAAGAVLASCREAT